MRLCKSVIGSWKSVFECACIYNWITPWISRFSMLILICRIRNRLEYLPGVCRISSYTYVTNGAFEDPIGLAGADCGSSGSTRMLHLSHLPFFE